MLGVKGALASPPEGTRAPRSKNSDATTKSARHGRDPIESGDWRLGIRQAGDQTRPRRNGRTLSAGAQALRPPAPTALLRSRSAR